MPAGTSAGRRSAELDQEAEALFSLALVKQAEARNYAVACQSEQGLYGILKPLQAHGWSVLTDRLWPGSKRANVDFILVGPPGVVIVDAKHWSEVEIRDDMLFRGDADEADELTKLDALKGRISEALEHTGLTTASVMAALAFTSLPLSPTRVGTVTAVGSRRVVPWLISLNHRLNAAQIQTITIELDAACPEMPAPETPRRVPQPRTAIPPEDPALIDVEAMTEALVSAALAEPIEEWMTFLHPDQNKLIRTRWNGPARVRGPAGTGKTVVGLHRAVHLAERSKNPVLFVSFVKTLPVVLSSLAMRLSPAGAANIEFTGVHHLATKVLETTNRKVKVTPTIASAAFGEAWRVSGAAKALGRIDERPRYWQEEIDHVIKGRGLSDFEQYASLARVGRKTGLTLDDRGHVWDLFIAYETKLAERNAKDFNDLLIEARQAVEEFPDLFDYSGVIIDEVQDLNLVGLQFLASIADRSPHSLLLVGDGQQSVYPGGFNLSEAGISVAGRASVLRVNYRNTVEIVETAAKVVARDTFDDLDGELVPGVRDAEVTRHGYQPLVPTFRTRKELDAALVDQLRATNRSGRPWGDLAVLLLGRKDVEHYRSVLNNADIPHVDLQDYDGTTSDRVRIGTVKRAKGLEFKFVLMPGLRHGDPAPWPGETEATYAERCERIRRELYVGMTRARDGLWLGYVP